MSLWRWFRRLRRRPPELELRIIAPGRWTVQFPGESASDAEKRLLAGGPGVFTDESNAGPAIPHFKR